MSLQQMFSIVIPVHNRIHLLRRALASVQRQTYAQFEVIIVDDGSDDDPEAVVAELRDGRFRIVEQENAGAAGARNRGATLAGGKLLTFLDSDDEAMPDWLECLHAEFSVFNADIVCCGIEKVGKGLEVKRGGGVLLPADMGPMYDHAVGKFTNGGSFAMKTDIFRDIGGYTHGLRSGQHTELAMRLLPLAKRKGLIIRNIMKPLIRVHVHDGPRIRGNPESIYEGSTYTLSKHIDLFEKDLGRKSRYHSIAGVNAHRLGKVKESRKHFREAIRAQPWEVHHWGRWLLTHVPLLAGRVWIRGLNRRD
jgi:glycosyltransferase involved in cell wall biosynthesis